jgi:signal transduction histidine kinase
MPLVEFDYGLILQAVTNLVDNAMRYEPSESQVILRGERDGRWALLQIINHGETISEDTKEHMMEPFFRGKDGKIGLGLPIARGIIEAHQGELRVEDTPGGGATFVVALPLKEDKTLETQTPGRG